MATVSNSMTGQNDSNSVLPAVVMWAQRAHCLYLTICLEDCKDPEIKLESNKLHFKGNGGTDKRSHECTLEFNQAIDPDNSKHVVRERGIEFTIQKSDETSTFWPRLLKESTKYHWLKVDFNKWKDEDDSEDEASAPDVGMGAGGPNFEEMMRNMGNLGGGGDLNPDLEEEDSDDENLPDLE